MSGVKNATVSNNLSKTMQLLREGLDECAKRTENTGSVGRKSFDDLKKQVEGLAKNLVRDLPKELKVFLRGEEAQWQSLLQRFDDALAKGRADAQAADQKGMEYDNLKTQATEKIANMRRQASVIEDRISSKSGYCDSEYKQARELRKKAEAALEELRSASNLGGKELTLRQHGAVKYHEAQNLAQLAQQEYDRLLNLGRDRQEKQRIAEENERTAKMLKDDIASLQHRIEAKNYAKFGKDAYTSAEKREIKAINDLCGSGKFEEAIPCATSLKARLARAVQVIEDAQLAWENAKTAAENLLADANEELKKIDRKLLETFAGQPTNEIETMYRALASASDAFVKEDFAAVSDNVPTIMEKLRDFAEKAAANQALHKQREEVLEALMQALYDSGYNPPEYYLKDERNLLSDCVIVAATPNGVGDIRMKITLAGEVDFEVMNVPVGQESICVNAVRTLQKNASQAGVEFNVTNWGRAENQGKEHIDITPKLTTQKTIERTKQG